MATTKKNAMPIKTPNIVSTLCDVISSPNILIVFSSLSSRGRHFLTFLFLFLLVSIASVSVILKFVVCLVVFSTELLVFGNVLFNLMFLKFDPVLALLEVIFRWLVTELKFLSTEVIACVLMKLVVSLLPEVV